MCQEAREMLNAIAGRFRFRPDANPPAPELLGDSVREANMPRAMQRFFGRESL